MYKGKKIMHFSQQELIIFFRQWMYLEPIFTSEDITKQLPVESKKYKSMERTWRRIMRGAYDVPNVITIHKFELLFHPINYLRY